MSRGGDWREGGGRRAGREGQRGCNGLVIRDNGCCDKVMVMKRPMGVEIR